MPKERRALRRHLRLKCSYAPDAHVVNISANGCKVESRVTPRLGEHVEFTAELVGRPALLRGAVVHARDGFEFGIRFIGLDEDVAVRVRAVATS
jgi:PilZ domain